MVRGNTKSVENATLLVVSSRPAARHALERLLAEAGYHVVVATQATEALNLLSQTSCHLALLEIDLPEVDGLNLCRLLRANYPTQNLRLLIHDGPDEEETRLAGFAAGADDYLAASVSQTELLARVRAHLESANRELALGGRNRELEFVADLGRSLLRATTPEQVARRLAGATYEGLNVPLCAVLLSLAEGVNTVYGFNREGAAQGSALVSQDHVNEWLTSPFAATPVRQDKPARFFLSDGEHRLEYAAPLIFENKSQGVLIVGFDRPEDCGRGEENLIEAAAQQASMAAYIARLYVGAQESSVRLAQEVELRTAEIEDQRRLTEAIIDSLPLSLYAIDRNYQVVAWNRRREDGGDGIPRHEALGRNLFEVLQRQSRPLLESEFARVFETGEVTRIEEKTTTPNGEEQYWRISKAPMRAGHSGEVSHVITIGENVTASVTAQRAVARAEKLAAVGRLAAGVVHEINNPLATISACAEALAARVREGAFDNSPEAEDLRDYLELIRNEVFRCKGITTGLLDFSRARPVSQDPVYVSEVLRSAARLMTHQGSSEVDIKLDLSDDVRVVMGDASQLQQAVIALATNAIDAMPEGGVLTFRARHADKKTVIEVQDTGLGIAPENLNRIFDPFFTTKEVGRGTGLGLAVCYGIVTEHGGRLDVRSQTGAGTTFTISLPAVNF